MRNTIKTIICFALVAVTLLIVSYDLLVKQEESSGRVAHLEGRVEELEQQAEQLNSKNASLTDAIQEKDEEIASLTDAVNIKIKDITTESTTETTEESTTEYVESDSMVFSKTKDDDDDEVFDVSVADGYKDAKEELDESDVIAEEDMNYTYLGVYELTAYIATGNPCADGIYPQVGYTIACNDPALWHKWVYIEGYGTYYCHDTGGMALNVIDVFVGSYDEAIQFGRRTANVYIINQ